MPRTANRSPHVRAVVTEQPTCAAIRASGISSAAASTILARVTRRCSLLPAAMI
ncbi:hypothetical protein [Frankia sp. Cppng1_Ct_nod]|uniref:hypothetical protein n=1 Tax=Frankia sp. Cppng1_Ct_nod TaxID=2897162 RepID=UPI001F5EC0C8|nr:hypothetical protein [Frankia sp. Cppng1_Ct_nod]